MDRKVTAHALGYYARATSPDSKPTLAHQCPEEYRLDNFGLPDRIHGRVARS